MIRYLFFPGQGSQKLGMGLDLAKNFSVASDVFNAVDETLKYKLSSIMWGEDQNLLTQTINAQPALMAVSIAIVEILKSETDLFEGNNIRYMAGHSLGEYSAFAAASSFSLDQCTKLLKLRGRSMTDASMENRGLMAAIIDLSIDKIQEICDEISKDEDEIVEIANFNSQSQIVISGHVKAVKTAMDQCKQAGAKRCLKLPVSAAFHSRLMKSSEIIMNEALRKAKISDALIPVICNVDAKPISKKDDIIDVLGRQIVNQVRWSDIMEFIIKDKGDDSKARILEIGTGNVLTLLAKKTGLNCSPINNYGSVRELIVSLEKNKD